MSKHTPGPWEITVNNYDHYGIHQAGMNGMAIIWINKQHSEMDDANARLIAAAPELLEALRQAADELDAIMNQKGHTAKTRAIRDTSYAAIAKAQGE